MINKLCKEICAGNNIRENLIQLNQTVKDEAFMEYFLDEYYENEAVFVGLLDHEDAKVRKNIIKLLGKVADPVLMEPLFRHYQAEETQFLKSDYLAALSEFEYKDYLPELKKRWEELSGQELTKHSKEEMKQLRKLIWKLDPPKRHTFSGYDMENKLLFIVPRGHEAAVLEQMEAVPETSGKTIPGGCLVTTKHLEDVCRIRTFQAVLFDFCPVTIHSGDGAVIGEKLLNAGMLEYIQKRHKEETPFLFRVEVKGIKDIAEKNRLAKDLSEYLEKYGKGKLVNEPSFYEAEIRVISGSHGSRVFLKLTCLADERFSYRKYTTSSSMNPAKAALMIHYVGPYLKPDANVLDPFCGTGTLLIERAMAVSSRSMYGLDISGQALQAAWENSHRANILLQLIQRNFNDFRHEYLFDEILTDMPRRGGNKTAREIEYLYHLLFTKGDELLSPDGIMAVYSEEPGMMEKELKGSSKMQLLKKYPMGRDQASWLYIMRKAGK